MPDKVVVESIIGSLPRYRCPKHGDVGTANLGLGSTEFKGTWEFQTNYCFFCFKELIEKYCHKLEIQDEHSS